MNEIRITTFAAPVDLEVFSSEEVAAIVVEQVPGPQGGTGPAGPDPWMEPVQNLEAAGAIIIDYALGKYVKLHITADVAISVINWPPADRISRLTLEILNDGFLITAWPTGTIWQSGSVPAFSLIPGARDRVILSSTDGGAMIFADPLGFDYR